MVESASINKSLFTLAKCVEAISQNHSRIPYRESKMTRILSLGQNNGLTVMILNLAPTCAVHLDTLSSLNFANRTKKIEVREAENEPIFKGCSRAVPKTILRQPLRPLASTVHNVAVNVPRAAPKQSMTKQNEKPKAFAVYSDKAMLSCTTSGSHQAEFVKRSSPLKRPLDPLTWSASHPPKRPSTERLLVRSQPAISKQAIEDIIERKVTDILAAKALDQPSMAGQPEISEEVQRRLELLEQKIGGKDDGKEKGLTFLLCAKQHAVRGEDRSALKMFALAKGFFPHNKKLEKRIEKLRKKLRLKKQEADRRHQGLMSDHLVGASHQSRDDDYKEDPASENDRDSESDGGSHSKASTKTPAKAWMPCSLPHQLANEESRSPSTRRLLDIINTRDVSQIQRLRGVGPKKADGIVETLCGVKNEKVITTVRTLAHLGQLNGIGMRTVENMRAGVQSAMVREQ